MAALKLAVVGAGAVGRRHAEQIAAAPQAQLSAIVDPAPVAEALARRLGTRWFASLDALLAAAPPDGLVVATPNQLHVDHGLTAVAAGVPVLVEKPIADSVAAGERLVAAAEAAGVPLLVGHHRRHNPMIRKAKEILDSGRLGRVLTLHGEFWLMKPDDYFEVAWRREAGAGPVLLNLIHDVDLFRYLCGEVAAVQAQLANMARGNAVEDTAVILLHFASGVLATVNVSDSVVAPWSWELTTGENPAYPQQDQGCYKIGGTEGSLTVPQLEVWSNPGKRSWFEPLVRERVPYKAADPLQRQIGHFCAVIRGEAPPLVSGREGLETLKVIEAVRRSAATGELISLQP